MKKEVFRNSAKLTGKQHLCQSLFFNKVAGLKFHKIPRKTTPVPESLLY